MILRAAVVVVFLALAGCCAKPPRDRGTFRRQTASDPVTTPPLPGWPDGWYYERVVDAGGGRGGYGSTKAEAMRNAGGGR